MLTSNAFQALNQVALREWDWRDVTLFYVSFDWGVAGGPEALAGRRLVRALLAAGARVHVLTAGGRDDELACPTYDVTAVPPPQLSTNRAVRSVQLLRCGIPEGPGLWVRDAVRAGRRVLASLPANTVIYSRAMPFASNIVAWRLARQTGRPWVAHFSDDWPPRQVGSGRRSISVHKRAVFQFWRRRVLDGAGALTFTNVSQAMAVLGRERERHLGKAFVVTHLPSAISRDTEPPHSDVFHLVHTGNFYLLTAHTARPLVQGLRLFLERTPEARSHVCFTQAGWSNGDLDEWTRQCGLTDVVRSVGRLPQADVAALLDSASVLIAVDYARPDSTTLLSKLPDYVAARRPILAITAQTSAMGRLFTENGAGVTARYDSPQDVADRIGALYEAWRHGRLDAFLPRPDVVRLFSRDRVLAELAGACLVARRNRGSQRREQADGFRLLGQTAQ